MPRPLTLFTGQWADLPFETICDKARSFGYDGLELCCWGDHFDVDQAAESDGYCRGRWEVLQKHGLEAYAISNHLMGQAVADKLIDQRHQAILPPDVWGDGDAEGVRQRAAEKMKTTARACRRFLDHAPRAGRGEPSTAAGPGRGIARGFTPVVNGFTGSPIWHAQYPFPPTTQDYWDRGFQEFADRWGPILDVFEEHEVSFGLEVHPTEIAFDLASAGRAVEAVGGHRRFGFNYDPSHLGYQGVDYVRFIREFQDRLFHVHLKDAWWGHGDGTVGVFGGHTDFGDPRRYWDFRSLGRGDVDFEQILVALNDVSYAGPLSVEWEDPRMDREAGATESAAFVKRIDFTPPAGAFDAAFSR